MKKNENNKEIEKIKINSIHQIGFWSRIKKAIFKLENYGEFVLEKTRVAISYFFKLILLVTILLSAISTYSFNEIVTRAFNYVKNELPDFEYTNGKMSFSENKEGYDEKVDFGIIIKTEDTISESIKQDLIEKVENYSTALILLSDTLIFTEYGQADEYKYTELLNNYNIEIINKTQLIELLDSVGIFGIDATYFVASVLSLYIVNVVVIIGDIILVYLFGLIISKLCGVNMPNSKILSLSIYSLTLSIILSAIYSGVYTIFGFVIGYFDIMYIMVAYVYLIAAILIIKSDVIKQKMELQKIIEVEKQVKKELQDKKEKEEENQKKEKKDKEKKEKEEDEDEPIINREPDGSEI